MGTGLALKDAVAARGGAPHLSIEGYRIVGKIGQGGMASVFLASAEPGAEPHVLKVLRIAGSETSGQLQRFMREYALLAQVRHPNVARIHRRGFSSGHAYLAMEFFPRGDLRGAIGSGMETARALACTRQIAAALDAIHGASIVHRDLKPGNVMLRADGSLALADFGIAEHVSMLTAESARGEVVGTPSYLSPEQASGRAVDHRCDLYSLGVMLYEMLTGLKPYRAGCAEDLLDLHINAPVPRLHPPLEGLQPLLERLMAKDRELRYRSARALLADLEEFALPDRVLTPSANPPAPRR